MKYSLKVVFKASLSIAVITVPSDNFYLLKNAFFLLNPLLTYCLNNLHGKISEIYGPENEKMVREDYKEVIRRKEPIEKEQELEFSGEKKWHLTTLTPILGKDGSVDKIIGSGKDITERKEMEKKFQKFSEESN